MTRMTFGAVRAVLCDSAGRFGCALGLLLACTFVPSPSAAQTPAPGGIAPPPRAERPYRGLFGGGVGETGQSLTFDGSFGAGIGDAFRPGSASPTGESIGLQGNGNVSASGNISYSMSRDKLSVFASNTILADYYQHPSGNRVLPRDIATAGATFSPTSTTGISFGLTYKNVPELSVSDFFDGEPDQVIPLNQNVGLSFERYNRYGTTLDVSQRVSRRGRISGGLSYARGMVGSRAWIILLYSGSASYTITKGLGVYGEYKDGGQRDDTPGLPATVDRHPRTSFGIDYNKPLSLSRRTTLTFSTGTAGMHDRNLDEIKYELVGSVNLIREIGRTWQALVGYSRDVRYIENLGQPLLGNYMTLGLQGSFSRRMQFQTRFGGSSGHLGTTKESVNKTEMYFGTAQLSVALTRGLALATDYGYYRYRLPSELILAERTGLNDYQIGRVYLQLWLPLITQRKR